MAVQLKSILVQITEEISTIRTLEEAQSSIITLVEASHINQIDKDKLITETKNAVSLNALLRYFYNALLKYEGMSLSNPAAKKK